MTWYVASFADSDTHLAGPVRHGHLISALCNGRQFRPLATLPGTPPDPEQTCPDCEFHQTPRSPNRKRT